MASGTLNKAMRWARFADAPQHQPDAKRDADRRQPWAALAGHKTSKCHDAAQQPRPHHRRAERPRRRRASRSRNGPKRHEQQQRQHDRSESQIEIWRADGDLFAGHSFERQRIERADEHGGAGRAEQQVVQHQPAFAADRRKQAAGFQRRRAPANSASAAADEDARGSSG